VARYRRKLDRDRLYLEFSRRLLMRLGKGAEAQRNGHAAYRLPDFYIIGAPRCGTTWLKVALDHCPGVLMLRGEPFVFTYHFDRDVETGLGKYDPIPESFLSPNDFEPARYSQVLLGEKSPDYFTMAGVRLGYFLDLNPRAKFIMICRDPTERLWSHVLHQFRADPEYVTRFVSSPSLDRSQEDDRRVWRFVGSATHFGLYRKSLQAWRAAVPEDRLLVLSFHDFEASPPATLERVLQFLGLNAGSTPSGDPKDRISSTEEIAPPAFFTRWAAELYGDEADYVASLAIG